MEDEELLQSLEADWPTFARTRGLEGRVRKTLHQIRAAKSKKDSRRKHALKADHLIALWVGWTAIGRHEKAEGARKELLCRYPVLGEMVLSGVDHPASWVFSELWVFVSDFRVFMGDRFLYDLHKQNGLLADNKRRVVYFVQSRSAARILTVTLTANGRPVQEKYIIVTEALGLASHLEAFVPAPFWIMLFRSGKVEPQTFGFQESETIPQGVRRRTVPIRKRLTQRILHELDGADLLNEKPLNGGSYFKPPDQRTVGDGKIAPQFTLFYPELPEAKG